MAKLINGKEISAQIRAEIKEETDALVRTGITPGLAVILVGDDQASQVYVRNKKKACEEVGFKSEVYTLPAECEEGELLALVDKLNRDDTIDGILCQLPLPKGLDENKVINAISPDKDVDCFSPVNVGRMLIGEGGFAPCTPAGCIELIKRSGYDICGKECVVIGRSNIVGKPVAALLMHNNGTVTICHSRTKNLPEVTRRADILIAAIGKAKFVGADMVKPGAVVIDVGINRNEEGKLCGDVDFDAVEPIAEAITPVPGGVGPMTITMLLKNTLVSAKKRADSKNI